MRIYKEREWCTSNVLYKESEWCTSKHIHRLEPKAQWTTNYNINTLQAKRDCNFFLISVFTTNQKLLLILGNVVRFYIYWYILILQLLLTLNPKTIFTTNKQKPKNHITGILPIKYSRGQDFILCCVIWNGKLLLAINLTNIYLKLLELRFIFIINYNHNFVHFRSRSIFGS